MRRCARIEREKWDVEIMRLKFGNQGFIDYFLPRNHLVPEICRPFIITQKG